MGELQTNTIGSDGNKGHTKRCRCYLGKEIKQNIPVDINQVVSLTLLIINEELHHVFTLKQELSK